MGQTRMNILIILILKKLLLDILRCITMLCEFPKSCCLNVIMKALLLLFLSLYMLHWTNASCKKNGNLLYNCLDGKYQIIKQLKTSIKNVKKSYIYIRTSLAKKSNVSTTISIHLCPKFSNIFRKVFLHHAVYCTLLIPESELNQEPHVTLLYIEEYSKKDLNYV